MKNIIAGFQFLTILPLPVKTTEKNLEKSMMWFPLIGAVIGLITGFAYRLLNSLFGANISSVLTILIYIVLTRGLHLDGFMDTIDGFFSHKRGNKDSILKIMKDPAVGSFAVLGVIIWSLVLFSTIPHLEPKDHVIIQTCTRLGILLMPLLFSYPRESGTGKFFTHNVKGKTLMAAMIITLAIMAVVYFIDRKSGVLLLVWGGLVLVSFLMALVVGFWSKKKIGGITGDILGFTIETTHLALLLLVSLVHLKGITF